MARGTSKYARKRGRQLYGPMSKVHQISQSAIDDLKYWVAKARRGNGTDKRPQFPEATWVTALHLKYQHEKE